MHTCRALKHLRALEPVLVVVFTWRHCNDVYVSTNVLSVRVSGELKSRLDALSATTGRSQAFYVREAVAQHIDALEWAYGVASTAEAVRAGEELTRPIGEVAAELGFDPEELRALGRTENPGSAC